MSPELEAATRIGVAALGGAAIGLERQWSGHASGVRARFGGVRTFTLLGGAAGSAAVLWNAGYGALATALLAASGALVVIGYLAASRRDVDATTEVAAMVVLAAGTLAGAGLLALASGVVAITALLLVEKSRLHALVQKLDDDEIRAGARFAVMAAVVLPLLPEGPFGPLGGVRPRELWALVLILSGLSFAGYGARRVLGHGHGDAVAGLLGGLVSSTSVTLAFARASRTHGAEVRGLAIGAIAASSVMFARLMLVTATLNPPLGIEVAWLLAAPLAAGAIVTAAGLLRRAPRSRSGEEPAEPRNPLQIGAALQMALLFQAVLMLVHFARDRFGGAGMLASGALLGLTDTDALAFSIARATRDGAPLPVGAAAIAVGGLANTLVKLGLALAIGSPGFRWRAGSGLAALAAATALALLALARGA